MTEDYEPNWDSLRKHPSPKWLFDAKFGLYFHWGPYSVAKRGCWYGHNMYLKGKHGVEPGSDWREVNDFDYHRKEFGDQGEFGYKDLIPLFKGENFDPEEWAELCERAGAKFAGPVAIFHDNFAMYDSDVTEWNSVNMGPKRDVVGELAEAIRDRRMKFVTTFHHAANWEFFPHEKEYDTSNPDYKALYGKPHNSLADPREPAERPDEEYFENWRDMTTEVMDKYRPDLVWFDFGWGRWYFEDKYKQEVLAHYYNKAEEWGKEVGVLFKPGCLPRGVGDFVDFERDWYRGSGYIHEKWITDTSIDRRDWSYVENPDYKPVDELISNLVDRVSKNGHLLLNVGPRADGSFPEKARERVLEIGNWLRINGESIFGTRPWIQPERGSMRLTLKGDTAYLSCFDTPGAQATVTGVIAQPDAKIKMLGSEEDLEWEQDDESLIIKSLPDELPTEHSHVFKIPYKAVKGVWNVSKDTYNDLVLKESLSH
ncbi:hypothetical protein AKJ41_02440 [candidate division MSBL1 archaeon SCGC-AAA259O05]|uniref:alpha-L-fucosidase n=1 Tax=candidate division MSBL1 archaeon SCGC-AAA259O05 TaxID=1698271 RepID=A0A133V434_9EURY|nr:hypothetical protein AKJ41_02440 [candidate division MSBL1 archaeon SCGC-AAA259O05]